MTDKQTKPRSKARKLTDIEIFYIEQKCKDTPIEEIAKDLKAPVRFIEDVYNAAVNKLTENKDPHILKLMNRNKEYGAVIMTQAASEVGDESKRQRKAKKTKVPSHIHKLKD